MLPNEHGQEGEEEEALVAASYWTVNNTVELQSSVE